MLWSGKLSGCDCMGGDMLWSGKLSGCDWG